MEYKNYLQEVGYRLKKQRIKLGLTQKQLADIMSTKFDLSDKQISRFECGENGTRLDKLVDLTIALGKTPDYFLLGIDRSDEYVDRIIDQIDEYLIQFSKEDVELVLAFIKTLHDKNK